jgi:hypothetical protein
MGADAIERLKRDNEQFTRELLEIMQPEKIDDFPNPYDAGDCELETLLDGHDDGSGLEPHRR